RISATREPFVGRSRRPASRDIRTSLYITDHARHQHARLYRHRLVHDAALGFVVAHLDLADQRKVLAERMPDKAVIGEDAPQVGMALENNAEEIERFALEPIGGVPDIVDRRDDRHLVVEKRTQ